MFKEMTPKKKMILIIIAIVVVISIILFFYFRNKKKKKTQITEQPVQTVTAPVVEKVKRSQIVPEEDLQAVKTTSETKLSVEEVIPAAKEPAAAATPQVNNGNMKEGKPAVLQTKASALPPEFMMNANNPSA